MDDGSPPSFEPIATGIPGLDDVLGGGLNPHRLYLIEGLPGAGKTTLSLQFLLQGIREGERGLYITLSETPEELRSSTASHGWQLAGLEFFELPVADDLRTLDSQSLMFHAAEVELGETVRTLFAAVQRADPARVVIDSLNAMPGERYLLAQLHELLMYLGQCGVVTILVVGQQGMIGSGMATPLDASYLADTVILTSRRLRQPRWRKPICS